MADTVRICKRCGRSILDGNAAACKKCQSEELADTGLTSEAWKALDPAGKNAMIVKLAPASSVAQKARYAKRVQYEEKYPQLKPKEKKETQPQPKTAPQGNAQESQEARERAERQLKQMKEDEEEIRKHNKGCLILLISLGLFMLACLMNGGILAGILGAVAFVLIFVGLIPWAHNRSASKIREDRENARAIVSLWAAKAEAGQSITGEDVDKAISGMGMDRVQKREQAKKNAAKIVKGAVVGGIVAGEPGAVVGAVIAKDKIDSEKKDN